MKNVAFKASGRFPGKLLANNEMKNILGGQDEQGVGSDEGCLVLGAHCNDSVQCCSNNCAADDKGTVTGKICKA